MNNTIRNTNHFRRVLPFGEMHACFPRGILPGDIDGEVEINGRFLWMEWKCGDPVIGGGQWLSFLKRLKLAGEMGTGMVIVHNQTIADSVTPNDVFGIRLLRHDRGTGGILAVRVSLLYQCSWPQLVEWLSAWSQHAQEIPNDFIHRLRTLKTEHMFCVENHHTRLEACRVVCQE